MKTVHQRPEEQRAGQVLTRKEEELARTGRPAQEGLGPEHRGRRQIRCSALRGRWRKLGGG